MGISVERLVTGSLAGIRDIVSLLPISVRIEEVNHIDPATRRERIEHAYKVISDTRLLEMNNSSQAAQDCYNKALSKWHDAKYEVKRRLVVKLRGSELFSFSYRADSIDAYLATLPPRVEYPF